MQKVSVQYSKSSTGYKGLSVEYIVNTSFECKKLSVENKKSSIDYKNISRACTSSLLRLLEQTKIIKQRVFLRETHTLNKS